MEGRITAEELEDIQHTQRRETAVQILSFAENDEQAKATMSGFLFFKRNRRRCCRSKRWKQRWFEIKDRVLYCYLRDANGQLCRAIPLIGVEVQPVDEPGSRRPYKFIVQSRQVLYQMSASSEEERAQWVDVSLNLHRLLVSVFLVADVARFVWFRLTGH